MSLSLGRCLRPALPMNRAVFHRLGLSVGIAIALAGCEPHVDARLKECVYVDRPALSTSGTRFRYVEENFYIDGPNICRKVTDTEGWERSFCNKGPDAAVCRKVGGAQ